MRRNKAFLIEKMSEALAGRSGRYTVEITSAIDLRAQGPDVLPAQLQAEVENAEVDIAVLALQVVEEITPKVHLVDARTMAEPQGPLRWLITTHLVLDV